MESIYRCTDYKDGIVIETELENLSVISRLHAKRASSS